jgi:hypothetical protein
VAGYRLDTLGLVESDPEGDLHEVVEAARTPGASRAGVSVALESASPEETALGLTDRALAALDPDTLLIDWEPCELAGAPAVRTLLLVQLGGLATVVLEQWRLVAAGETWLVTATADLATWARLAGRLRGVVATLEVGP